MSPGAGKLVWFSYVQSSFKITERNPAAFAAPSHMDDLAPEREHVLEFLAGVRREFLLEFRFEIEGAGLDPYVGHDPRSCGRMSSRSRVRKERALQFH
jgi:hypothetical protein